ncbi:hypothetical protein [Methanoplanus endosymbiosus]|uniref:Uncharacterized protein n=1 Tax=Methanoplanus endosymbiosus TaxID=33865 RepID=A0A9E7TKF7_9EURY|nr:hypothetical protein [Methanoplanus endosymbiosus]UUX92684.1 hypothetical protein L6E24_00725 [Methanoplanus endosymbiosus]
MDKAGLIKYITLSAAVFLIFIGIAGAMGSSPDIYNNNTELFSTNADAEAPLPNIISFSEENLSSTSDKDLISKESTAKNQNNYTDEEESINILSGKELNPENSALKSSNTSINFFYSERCGACHKALPVVKELSAKYPNIPVYYYDTYNSPKNRSVMYTFAAYYGVDYPAYPNLFAGNSIYLEGFTEINNNIEDLFIAYDSGLIPDYEYEAKWQDKQEGNISPDNSGGDSYIRNSGDGGNFGEVGLPLVLIGGLLDGINPCAISVLLILLASLSAAGSRRTILSAGISYTFAVFIFYTLAGVGILAITGFAGISFYFSLFAFAVALLAGILSIYEGVTGRHQDFIRIPESAKGILKKYYGKLQENKEFSDEESGDDDEAKDRKKSEDKYVSGNDHKFRDNKEIKVVNEVLPEDKTLPSAGNLSDKITSDDIISEAEKREQNISYGHNPSGKNTGCIVATAFILGTLASMFELPCTGGIYVAVLSMISNSFSGSLGASGFSGLMSGNFTTGIIYLLLYNLMFILPLVFIILLMASGLPAGKTEKIDAFRTEKRRAIRIISGIVMIILAIYLGLGISGII